MFIIMGKTHTLLILRDFITFAFTDVTSFSHSRPFHSPRSHFGSSLSLSLTDYAPRDDFGDLGAGNPI